jgi:hypothetical protein
VDDDRPSHRQPPTELGRERIVVRDQRGGLSRPAALAPLEQRADPARPEGVGPGFGEDLVAVVDDRASVQAARLDRGP